MVNCFKRTSILILLALFSFLNAQEFWIKTRPVAPKYYIGIASGKTKEEAKTKALNDLASEISVSINSELVDIMTEYSGFSEDYTRSQITVSVAQDLEGYERVGEDKVDDQAPEPQRRARDPQLQIDAFGRDELPDLFRLRAAQLGVGACRGHAALSRRGM